MMEMNVSIERLKLIRPDKNPRNKRLNINIDWSIEYENIENNYYKYMCNLEMKEFPILFIVEGHVLLNGNDENLNKIPEEVLNLILNKISKILIEIIGITNDWSLKVSSSLDYKLKLPKEAK